MNWRRTLSYLAAMALIVTITMLLLAGFSLGDCGVDSPDCKEKTRIIFPAVLVSGALALAYLVYRFIRDPRGRD